jgi:hypothetical protein
MKAEKLRIGNFLNYYGQDVIVLELLKNNYAEFGYFRDSIGFNRKLTEKHSPKPIPLTEEWLLKFGLNSSDYITLDKEECILIDIHQNTVWIGNKKAFQYAVGVYIKHVHQLQNLYYALTQKELNYER